MALAWNAMAMRRTRRPTLSSGSSLRHCISTVDLTSLGLANTVGLGLYVLLSHAAHDSAGPSVVLSFILLSVAAMLSGLCIVDLAEAFPATTGWSSYVYSYAVFGELCAFLLGWNIILELALGSAVAAKAWSRYADLVFGGLNDTVGPVVTTFGNASMHLRTGDVTAFFLLLATMVFTSMYVKVVCVVNNVLVFVCLLFAGGTVFVGLFKIEPKNWTSGAGFFPNGLEGILAAASLCAFSFVGMELMTASSAETKRESGYESASSDSYYRMHSTSTNFVFVVGLVTCFAFAVIVTLVVPHSQLADSAPVARIFVSRGVAATMTVFVFVGATCGLFASMLACGSALSRVVHTMACDGLLPKFLVAIHPDRGTPVTSALVCGIASALLALLLDLRTMLPMLGIGSLFGMATAPVLVLTNRWTRGTKESSSSAVADDPKTTLGYGSLHAQDLAVELEEDLSFRTFTVAPAAFSLADDVDDDRRMPCVSWLRPLLCLSMHVIFLVSLPTASWIRLLVWSALGLIAYAANRSCRRRGTELKPTDAAVDSTHGSDRDRLPVLPDHRTRSASSETL